MNFLVFVTMKNKYVPDCHLELGYDVMKGVQHGIFYGLNSLKIFWDVHPTANIFILNN